MDKKAADVNVWKSLHLEALTQQKWSLDFFILNRNEHEKKKKQTFVMFSLY